MLALPWNPLFIKYSAPDYVDLFLSHQAFNDICGAFVAEIGNAADEPLMDIPDVQLLNTPDAGMITTEEPFIETM